MHAKRHLTPDEAASLACVDIDAFTAMAPRYRLSIIERCEEIGWAPSSEILEAELGIPIGWTEPAPLETARFREWSKLHETL